MTAETRADLELESPPPVIGPNPMPLDWSDKIARHRTLWQIGGRALRPQHSYRLGIVEGRGLFRGRARRAVLLVRGQRHIRELGRADFRVRDGHLLREPHGRFDLAGAADDRAGREQSR